MIIMKNYDNCNQRDPSFSLGQRFSSLTFHPLFFYFFILLSYSPILYTTNYSLHWSHCWLSRLQQDLCPWFSKCCRRSRSLTQACASGLMYKISSSSKKTVYLTCFTWTKCSRICITSDTCRHQSKRDAGTIFLA